MGWILVNTWGSMPSRAMAKRVRGGVVMQEFMVDRPPPKAMPAASRARGSPRIPAAIMASA